jgi:hypothetical protein
MTLDECLALVSSTSLSNTQYQRPKSHQNMRFISCSLALLVTFVANTNAVFIKDPNSCSTSSCGHPDDLPCCDSSLCIDDRCERIEKFYVDKSNAVGLRGAAVHGASFVESLDETSCSTGFCGGSRACCWGLICDRNDGHCIRHPGQADDTNSALKE